MSEQENKKNELMCDIVDKVGILASIELHNEIDRIDATKSLLESHETFQKFCKRESASHNCGKKLPGIERA